MDLTIPVFLKAQLRASEKETFQKHLFRKFIEILNELEGVALLIVDHPYANSTTYTNKHLKSDIVNTMVNLIILVV